MKTCKIKDCLKPSRAKGMCHSHYEKWRRYEFTKDKKCIDCGNRVFTITAKRCNNCSIKETIRRNKNSGVFRRGANHPFWKGGKTHQLGYKYIYAPDHPFARSSSNKDGRGIYVLEHRLVMEKFLGRYLKPYEYIHHKNGIRNDNRIENLKLVTINKHWHPQVCPKCGFEFLIK